ncbi:MAG: hypothetical protein GY822_02375 [Deltaproteobacteria bacterium]|nr:hypothetical protein [Deltaproteobacteria bacterium]
MWDELASNGMPDRFFSSSNPFIVHDEVTFQCHIDCVVLGATVQAETADPQIAEIDLVKDGHVVTNRPSLSILSSDDADLAPIDSMLDELQAHKPALAKRARGQLEKQPRRRAYQAQVIKPHEERCIKSFFQMQSLIFTQMGIPAAFFLERFPTTTAATIASSTRKPMESRKQKTT